MCLHIEVDILDREEWETGRELEKRGWREEEKKKGGVRGGLRGLEV